MTERRRLVAVGREAEVGEAENVLIMEIVALTLYSCVLRYALRAPRSPVISDSPGVSAQLQVQTAEVEVEAAASFQTDSQSYLDFYTSKVPSS